MRLNALFYLSLAALAPLAYLSFWTHVLSFWPLGFPLAVAVLVKRAALRHRRRINELEHLLSYYGRRLRCVTQEWMGKGDSGLDLRKEDHLSARDLDLFGISSTFERLCDVGTPMGREALARWLQEPASHQEATARQEAVRWLRDRTELRENLAMLREGEANKPAWFLLRDWLLGTPTDFPRPAVWAAFALPLLMVVTGGAWGVGVLQKETVLLALSVVGMVEGGLALWLRNEVQAVLRGQEFSARKVGSLLQLCKLVRDLKFEGKWLIELQARLQGSVESITELQKMLIRLESRKNEWFWYIAVLLMWTTQWTMRIERWRNRRVLELASWFTALGEFEAIVAIAAYAFENPQDPFAEFSDESPCFEGAELRHPLMEFQACIPNDVKLDGGTQFLLVTGSNMSGKSTLLRTVGLNTTLARMGAPVRAAKLRLSELEVCASIRVEDSLLNGRSRFFAEVQRLKATLDRAAHGVQVLFLIDELLGGTNSADRRVAAEGVIQLLVERRAIGLVTSHDLALTEIPHKDGMHGLNVHFSDKPTAEGLSFDYILRPGKVDHSNALKIISMIGIPIGG